MSKQSITEKIYRELRENRGDDGAAVIRSKDVAKLIRARLRARFPGQKFSVRSEHNSIRIYWQDGPCEKQVNGIVQCYSFGGFDGMIDLAYDSDNWLLPDGTMEAASSMGTEGSRGTVPSYTTDCPEPGAILVEGGPRYVFTNRQISDERMAELVEAASKHYGFEYDRSKSLHQQRADRHGEWITTLAYRLDQETAAQLTDA